MQATTLLIKKIATHPSTEELILFIANDDEMTRACVTLQKRLNSHDSSEIKNIAEQCRSNQISIDLLVQEIQNILAIFSPDPVNDEYAVLGLDTNASLAEIKQAFRQLSIKYHPDSGSSTSNSDKFIETCQAYKTIISRHGRTQTSRPNSTNWHYRKKRKVNRHKKRKNIFLLSALAILLFIFSIVAPVFYKKKVMQKNLSYADPVLVKRVIPENVALPDNQESPAEIDQIVELNVSPQDDAKELQDEEDEPQQTEQISETLSTEMIVVYSPVTEQSSPEPLQAESVPLPLTELPLSPSVSVTDTPTEAVSGKRTPANVPRARVEVSEKIMRQQQKESTIKPKPAHITAQTTRNNNKKYTETAVQKKPQTPTYTYQEPQKEKIEPATALLQQPVAKPVLPSLASLNSFLNAYTTTYEGKNFQHFTRFFTADATENEKLFSEQQEKYLNLFQSIEKINFDIGILSSAMQDEDILVTGRFRAMFVYPKTAPIYRKGSITMLLQRDKKQRYLIKRLNYTFQKK